MGNNFKKIANEELQPDNFSFSNENLLKAKDIVKMYPKKLQRKFNNAIVVYGSKPK